MLLLGLAAILSACSEPPPPPAARRCGPTGGATAPHVCWSGPAPTGRPIALLAGLPGGTLDRIAGDPDVTTFLNDRFEPRFVAPDLLAPPGERTLLLGPRGCVLPGGELRAESPAGWIDAVNTALRAGVGTTAPPLSGPVPGLGADHPLRTPCSGHSP